ncbi:MAG: hypothetical protein JJT76_19055 [Clostridiaceae bacterium]|nr:hypothetical protein [Clostridiaceae bacterium]
MIIHRKYIVRIIIIFLIGALLFSALFLKVLSDKKHGSNLKIGGYVHNQQNKKIDLEQSVFYSDKDSLEVERFQRPSTESQLQLQYELNGVEGDQPPYIPKGYPEEYETSLDVIHGYYSLLKESSNMVDFAGGCGSIGWGKIPYYHAYQLLTEDTKKQISLDDFAASFAGIGHMTVLKLLPAYRPQGTPYNIDYHFLEVEVITGPSRVKERLQPSYFAYYYGIVATEFSEYEGWKIKSVHYIPQDFLCAPYHLWQWDSRSLTEFLYTTRYDVIDKIDGTDKKDGKISIYASGKGKKYKFDFIRLTNGEDILLHEYVEVGGTWREINILEGENQSYKMSPLRFNIFKN